MIFFSRNGSVSAFALTLVQQVIDKIAELP